MPETLFETLDSIQVSPLGVDIFEASDVVAVRSGNIYTELSQLYTKVFGGDIGSGIAYGACQEYFSCLLCYEDGALVGFKIGWQQQPSIFFSWAGCVAPTSRKKGYASALMGRQHAWCRDRGFSKVITKCRPSWPEMMSLNRKFGFSISESYSDKNGSQKYILELTFT